MKVGIVPKLFILTTLLCMLILLVIFVGQTIFFKQFYANQKVNEIQASMQSFEIDFINAEGDPATIQKLQEEFYQANQTWITPLDHLGNIKFADDFSVTLQVNATQNQQLSNQVITIPLYSFMELEEVEREKFYLAPGKHLLIDGLIEGHDIIPSILTVKDANKVLENRHLSDRLYGPNAEVETSRMDSLYVSGEIKELQLPVGAAGSALYTNRVFIERIKQFQANLIINDDQSSSAETLDYEENGIQYKIFIRPVTNEAEETVYLFAMTSLQPVDEAVQMVKDYYAYLLIFVLLLIILVSLYYSKKIAKPLLQINETAGRMARLDFSEKIPVASKDEIGALSHNINTLSTTLHSYIQQLQEDIEKEKQLERTRKEFISGVSHELKTPLSVLKSCLSILEDGIANNKKDYYFQAMIKEVDKMDRLIVEMLELAKFESGTYKMKMDVFSIDQLIEHICEKLALEIANKQLELVKQLSGSQVVANQDRIEQVVTNFMTNAIRYTPVDHKIILSTIEEDTRVKVCVENKGAHIEQEHLQKIWDRFYRGHIDQHHSKDGTGLGLAISKNILELHGVEYGAANTEDGVLFFFTLNKKI